MAFSYNTENGGSLTPSQEDLLGGIETLPFPFKGITTLKTFRERKQIQVVVSGRAFLVKLLENNIERISEQINKYQNDPNRAKIMAQIERDIYERRRWAERQLEEAKNPNKRMTLLGLYSRKLLWFDNSAPVVYLFADNINDCANAAGQNPDNMFGYVFIHEMMHAYYDAFNSDGYPSWEELEEAFAEFGMLTFLKNSLGLPVGILNDAIDHVREKIMYGPREYGFGYELFDRTGGGDKMMINRYMEISNWIDAEQVYTLNPNYFHDIWTYKRDPNDENATKCFKGVEEILKYPWEQPKLLIQHRFHGSHTMDGTRSATIRPTDEWALTVTPANKALQVPLIREKNRVKLIAEIVKALKAARFERYLTLDGDYVTFLGKELFSATGRFPRSHYLAIPEEVNLNCICVQLYFDAIDFNPRSKRMANLMQAMSIMYDGTFTLVRRADEYTLYGPLSLESHVLTGSEAETGSDAIETDGLKTGRRKTYEIRDRSTSKVLYKEKSKGGVAYSVVKDLCDNNPGIELADLQDLFREVRCIPKALAGDVPNNVVMPQSEVNMYYADLAARGLSVIRRFLDKYPIMLSSGETIVVTSQWEGKDGDIPNFETFKQIAESLGYTIIEY